MLKFPAFVCALLLSAAVFAADTTKLADTLIDLSAEASVAAANDLAQASAYVEMSDARSDVLAARLNHVMAQGLATAKAYAAIKTRSGPTWTQPVYGKNGRSIEAWRMHAELLLESRDMAALAELLGRLQTTFAVGQISLASAPETRRKAEEAAMQEAIVAFQEKAKRVATALGKPYRIRQLSIGAGAHPPVYAMARAALSQAEASPLPIEAGESTVTVTISGQIELAE